MFRTPRAGVEFGDVVLTWYANQGDEPLASPRGQLQDHIALSVADLDAWVAKLRGEGVDFLEGAVPARRHPRGDDRRPEPRGAGAGRGQIIRGRPGSGRFHGSAPGFDGGGGRHPFRNSTSRIAANAERQYIAVPMLISACVASASSDNAPLSRKASAQRSYRFLRPPRDCFISDPFFRCRHDPADRAYYIYTQIVEMLGAGRMALRSVLGNRRGIGMGQARLSKLGQHHTPARPAARSA